VRRHRIVIAVVAGLLSLPGALLAILVMYTQAQASMTLLILPFHGDVAGGAVWSLTTLLLYLLYLAGIIAGLRSVLIDSSRRKASCWAALTIVGLVAAVFLEIREGLAAEFRWHAKSHMGLVTRIAQSRF
jgi:hypothetical protein